MRPLFPRCILFSLLAFAAGAARSASLESERATVTVEPSGEYRLLATTSGWTLAGKLPGPAHGIKTEAGADKVGKYRQLAFAWKDGERDLTGFIRLYERGDHVLFSDTLTHKSDVPAAPFPDFTELPRDLFHFSYKDIAHSPPQFNFGTTSAPWLLFDARDNALLISAASHFAITTLLGDGKTHVASGYSPTLANLPAEFTHQTLLAFGRGINATFDLWGHALTDLHGKTRPANDADTLLKYYGYWTDNGAVYYYAYNPAKGYAGTLLNLVETYRREKIPIHYLQLDSWWYHKTYTSAEGKEGKARNASMPAGDWNCYGGLLDYTASDFVFPEGLEHFQHALGLPLVTHNRWVDPASPYHQHYKISGIAAVDPAFWEHIAGYLKTNGIATYEQDWLSAIYPNSPELGSTPDLGDTFLDGMARACRAQGITIQYCMALPRCFLQASKYDNVTTIRVSEDRFEPKHYHSFLYASRFASALGIWPWTDAFKSWETNNLLLSNLSAGPVGTGDGLGKENRENLLKVMRADGVIIKPDAPLVPVDAAYIAEAQKQTGPLVATTYTDHGKRRTVYAVAFDPAGTAGAAFKLGAGDLGSGGPVCVYDYFAAKGGWLEKGKPYEGQLGEGGLTYLVAAAAGPSGIAFLGDRDKFVSMGRQRVASLDDEADHLTVGLLLTAAEESVVLHGYCHRKPAVAVKNGAAEPVDYDAATGHFAVTVRPDASAPLTAGTDPVRQVEVTVRAEAD